MRTFLLLILVGFSFSASAQVPAIKRYRDVAANRDGDPVRGRDLFFNESKGACAKCHSVDGSASKAGPDLFAVGDKFPRREIIEAILEPSTTIAVGYGATIVETKTGDEFIGVIKEASETHLELKTAAGESVRIAVADVRSQRGSAVSLMPEGLHTGLSREEFTDLVQFLTTLREPENFLVSKVGMPAEIPELARPVELRPFFEEQLRFPHAFVHKPGDIRSGLVGFSQAPAVSNLFFVVHQTGKIWLLEKSANGDHKTLFADFSSELFNERGPNGLLGMAFHPKYRENGRYFLKHQVFENGKIATILVEKLASADRRHDSGTPSRRLLKMVSVTQDHSGGCIEFGPDGYLYLGMGDTGPQQDPQGHGQDMHTFLGKIIRIDVDQPTSELPYGIPVDNPFLNQAGARPEIWASGFREPWRFTFDSLTGDLWVGDVGQDRVEEVAIVRRGENHGWNVYEGFEPFSNRYRKPEAIYVRPVFAYRRKYGNSVTGGYVYRADAYPVLQGVYIFGDYCSGIIWATVPNPDGSWNTTQMLDSEVYISSFGQDENGELYITDLATGVIYQVTGQ